MGSSKSKGYIVIFRLKPGLRHTLWQMNTHRVLKYALV